MNIQGVHKEVCYILIKISSKIVLACGAYCTSLSPLFWVSLVLNGQYWVLPGLTRPYWALLGFTGPYWALLGLTGPYCWALLLGLTGPY